MGWTISRSERAQPVRQRLSRPSTRIPHSYASPTADGRVRQADDGGRFRRDVCARTTFCFSFLLSCGDAVPITRRANEKADGLNRQSPVLAGHDARLARDSRDSIWGRPSVRLGTPAIAARNQATIEIRCAARQVRSGAAGARALHVCRPRTARQRGRKITRRLRAICAAVRSRCNRRSASVRSTTLRCASPRAGRAGVWPRRCVLLIEEPETARRIVDELGEGWSAG